MNWVRSHRRAAILIGLTLLLPVYFYLKTVFGLMSLALDYADDRGRIEPRVARLQGLLESEERLLEQSELAAARLREAVFPAADDPSALAATLQADVRQLFAVAGMSVSNSQVLPLRQGDDFDRVAVKLTVSGSLRALDGALDGLAAYRPQLLVESIDTFPVRSSRRRDDAENQELTAVVQLMVLRALR